MTSTAKHIERSGENELVVDSWCRVAGGSEMTHVINGEGEVKGGFVENQGYIYIDSFDHLFT